MRVSQTLPKWVADFYGATPEQWEATLAFIRAAEPIFAKDWQSIKSLFDTVKGHNNGLHSASSSFDAKQPFPWLSFSRYSCAISQSFALSIELESGEFRDLFALTLD